MASDKLVPRPHAELVKQSEVPSLLAQVRPSWREKNLIVRVKRLLDVDPSSACQRLFNAAVHDLREKLAIAGVDIAGEAARQHKLPPIEKQEDLEEYSTAKLIDLAYRIGLLSRPEWRRLSRCYEIRRDLEHEDDEYEAGVEDCIYIFKTCVEVVLAKDPIHLLRVQDVKEIVEESTPVVPSEALVDEYQHAPQPRQEEISRFLVSIALDKQQSDVVQQNAFRLLIHLSPSTHNAVKLKLAAHLQEKVGRRHLSQRQARVALASGAFPYLRKSQVRDFFESVLRDMKKVGTQWRGFPEHGELLRSFREVGGLDHSPEEKRSELLRWLVLTYIGESGGLTSCGHVRHVFYSDTAAPLIREIIGNASSLVREELKGMVDDPSVKRVCQDVHVARRFEELIDLIEGDN